MGMKFPVAEIERMIADMRGMYPDDSDELELWFDDSGHHMYVVNPAAIRTWPVVERRDRGLF